MKGNDFIEKHGLREGQYTGYDGDFVVTGDELEEMKELIFTPEEIAAMEAEKQKALPVVDLITDEFIQEAARLGEVDLDTIKAELEGGIENALGEVTDDSAY